MFILSDSRRSFHLLLWHAIGKQVMDRIVTAITRTLYGFKTLSGIYFVTLVSVYVLA